MMIEAEALYRLVNRCRVGAQQPLVFQLPDLAARPQFVDGLGRCGFVMSTLIVPWLIIKATFEGQRLPSSLALMATMTGSPL